LAWSVNRTLNVVLLIVNVPSRWNGRSPVVMSGAGFNCWLIKKVPSNVPPAGPSYTLKGALLARLLNGAQVTSTSYCPGVSPVADHVAWPLPVPTAW
jgi:hypothetical protein